MGGLFLESSFAFHPNLVIDYVYSQDLLLDLTDFTAEIFA